jgi:hypothetical protein
LSLTASDVALLRPGEVPCEPSEVVEDSADVVEGGWF